MPYKNQEDKKRWEREHRAQRNAQLRKQRVTEEIQPTIAKRAPARPKRTKRIASGKTSSRVRSILYSRWSLRSLMQKRPHRLTPIRLSVSRQRGYAIAPAYPVRAVPHAGRVRRRFTENRAGVALSPFLLARSGGSLRLLRRVQL